MIFLKRWVAYNKTTRGDIHEYQEEAIAVQPPAHGSGTRSGRPSPGRWAGYRDSREEMLHPGREADPGTSEGVAGLKSGI
jgi:hypothetical protein